MPRLVFRDLREFKVWNDAMVRKYDVELFHEHPSPLVRWVEHKRVDRLLALLAPSPSDRVLEIGCGAGHLLARVGSRRAFGLDLSEHLLGRALARLGRPGVLVQGDAEHLPFRDRSCERLYCSEVLEHLAHPAAVLQEVGRVLAQTGVAVLSVPNERVINRLKAVVRQLHLSRLVLRAREHDYTMPERMDDEWHLHTFDLASLLALVPPSLRVAAVQAVPYAWLPLRYVVRCEPADRPPASFALGARARLLSAPWLFGLTQWLFAADLRPVRRQIMAWLGSAPRTHVLDVGCGIGSFARLALGAYVGIDPDVRAIARARSRFRRDPAKQFIVADALSVALPARAYDLVIFANTLHHLPDPEALATLRVLARVSAGPIVVVDPAIETVRPLSRLLLAVEEGRHLRPLEAQRGLLEAAGLRIEREATLYAGLASQRLFLCSSAASAP
jgi:ubiquinone/menaquinone biosynthesis C-methylase UbiE